MNDFNQAETRTAYLDLHNAKGLHLEDLTKTQINRVYLYAKKNEQEGITWANLQAAHDEQKRGFEHWLKMYLNYWQAKRVIKKIDKHRNKPNTLQTEITPDQTKKKPKKLEPERLADLITHLKSKDIIQGIKVQYKNIKGKRLKLLLLAFQDLQLLPNDGIAKKFHNCCTNEFEWDIASYNAMQGYDFNDKNDNEEREKMKLYIKGIINT